MSKTVSALTEAATVATTDILAMVVGANSRKVTLAKLFAAANLYPSANLIEQRNGASAQTYRLFNTYTDASNYERGFVRWTGNVFQIGAESAGTGSARNVEIVSAAGLLTVPTYLRWSSGTRISGSGTNGILLLQNGAGNDFTRLQFGGSTASYPSLKRSTTEIHARLADDSDFAPLQGKLKAHANAAAETPSATHTLRVFDAAGTEYKVLAVPA